MVFEITGGYKESAISENFTHCEVEAEAIFYETFDFLTTCAELNAFRDATAQPALPD